MMQTLMFLNLLLIVAVVLFLEVKASETDSDIIDEIEEEERMEASKDKIIVSSIDQCEIEYIGSFDTVELTKEDILSIVDLNQESIGKTFLDLLRGSIVKCDLLELAQYICVNVLHVAYQKGSKIYLEPKYYY